MATEAEASGDGVEENDEVAPEQEGGGSSYEEGPQSYEAGSEEPEDFPHFVEIWNDYDPSQRFTAIFPVGEKEGAVGSSVAYYIIEPGSHTGLHSDNVEEIAFVAEGEGEVFSIGNTQQLEAGKFVVFAAGADHDIYARGSVALRLLSFFPTPRDHQHLPAGRLPARRDDAQLEAAAARRHRARPEQPAGGLPVHPRRARDGRGERGAARAEHDPAPDRDDRPEHAAGERRGEDLHARRGSGRSRSSTRRRSRRRTSRTRRRSPAPRGRGGTGRRAGFRSRWA